MADLKNPNDFQVFANGGWDGGWYVSYNTCWMQKLTVPRGKYKKAYIGAKLGRMKSTREKNSKPWERKAIKGKIYIGLSPTASWSRSQSYFLASTHDIPLEAEKENAIEGVGESRWIWTEVPLKMIKQGGDNYLALWSPTEALNSVETAPILAAGWGNRDVNSWVSHDIKGIAPTDPKQALSTPITIFEPAIAIKLIPEMPNDYDYHKPKVTITSIEDGEPRGKSFNPKVVCSNVEGHSIEAAYLEISLNKKEWGRVSRIAWNPPYCFTLNAAEIPTGRGGKTWIRITAGDIFENLGQSEVVDLFSPLP